jgi:DnaJ-domain-containing protein 1
MFELAGALIIGLVTLQGIKLVLARGIFLGSRHQEPQRNAKRRPLHPRWARTEQEPRRQQQLEQERQAERWRHRLRGWASKQSEESEWWSVLEVSPYVSADEIRRSYLRKIKQCRPDRVVSLAPEFIPLAEVRAKSLNAAYAEAIRARRKRVEV